MSMIGATVAIVSTLFTTVGEAKTPEIAGNGGFERGCPRLPSSDSMSAVSSPQMYAPAPRWSTIVTSPRRSERAAENLVRTGVLAADVDEDVLRLDRVRGDQAAFQEPVRDPRHDLVVLEAAGLRLVGVDDEVVRLRDLLGLRHERPLASGGEERAAAAAQLRRDQLVGDLRRCHRTRLRERAVAAHSLV